MRCDLQEALRGSPRRLGGGGFGFVNRYELVQPVAVKMVRMHLCLLTMPLPCALLHPVLPSPALPRPMYSLRTERSRKGGCLK